MTPALRDAGLLSVPAFRHEQRPLPGERRPRAAPATVETCRYILWRDAAAYHDQGWTVTPFDFHHGANGYALATIELPA